MKNLIPTDNKLLILYNSQPANFVYEDNHYLF